jgi:hypothetical protein
MSALLRIAFSYARPLTSTVFQLNTAGLLWCSKIEEDGRLPLKMDSACVVELDSRKHLHLDHGYAMTSHSSQGQTADRVLIHVDTELGAKDLLNSRTAYVSVSRWTL